MLYNIFHQYGSQIWREDIGKDRDFVEKMVNAYVRGEAQVTIAGEQLPVGNQKFIIYQAPDELDTPLKLNSFVSIIKTGRYRGKITKELHDREFKNVTDFFLKGRSWGALKDELYNVYLNLDGKKKIKTTVEKSELLKFINDWQHGQPKGWLEGSEILLNTPSTFQIFDIKPEYIQENKGETKKYLNNEVRLLFNGEWSIRVLEIYGKDVTSSFSIGPFGSRKSVGNSKALISNMEIEPNKTGRIFISHSSKDAEIVRKFTDEILILSLGTDRSKIFCTSIEGMGVKSGEDFRSRIKKELLNAEIIIQIISKSYKASEVCLNEMGAAWVLSDKVIPLILDGDYDVGFINSTTHQLSLTKKKDLLEFIDDHERFFTNKAGGAKIDGHIEAFLKAIQDHNA